MTGARRLAGLLVAVLAAACASSGGELQGLAGQPPLDCAVLVTGGAYLTPTRAGNGTFADPGAENGAASDGEAIPIATVIEVLERTGAFQRIALDPDPADRRRRRDALIARAPGEGLLAFLQQARADGFDLLLVIEELQDGPIEQQGTNSRWPVTFATWILLGVGMLIPDRTFESRAALRVTLRDLQTGRVLEDPLLTAGPIDLALTERGDFLGIVTSIIVPPFWVGDDDESVRAAVRETTQRRLLLSLAQNLKSESVRQHLRERSPASLALVDTPSGRKLMVDSFEGLSGVRLRTDPALDDASAMKFEQELLGSVTIEGVRYHYEAPLPPAVDGKRLQVLVGTLRGGVASATFVPGGGQ